MHIDHALWRRCLPTGTSRGSRTTWAERPQTSISGARRRFPKRRAMGMRRPTPGARLPCESRRNDARDSCPHSLRKRLKTIKLCRMARKDKETMRTPFVFVRNQLNRRRLIPRNGTTRVADTLDRKLAEILLPTYLAADKRIRVSLRPERASPAGGSAVLRLS
jgi:hypothetical protein